MGLSELPRRVRYRRTGPNPARLPRQRFCRWPSVAGRFAAAPLKDRRSSRCVDSSRVLASRRVYASHMDAMVALLSAGGWEVVA